VRGESLLEEEPKGRVGKGEREGEVEMSRRFYRTGVTANILKI